MKKLWAQGECGPANGGGVCAWCTHRDGDLCTHPESPVNQGLVIEKRIDILTRLFRSDDQLVYGPGECGPVCIGDIDCHVEDRYGFSQAHRSTT